MGAEFVHIVEELEIDTTVSTVTLNSVTVEKRRPSLDNNSWGIKKDWTIT